MHTSEQPKGITLDSKVLAEYANSRTGITTRYDVNAGSKGSKNNRVGFELY